MSAQAILFYLFGTLAIAGALGMVLNLRNVVASAMSLVVTMVALGAVYVLLEAYLVAAIQIMVYGGAIVVLFLFVVMLLNLATDELPPGGQKFIKFSIGLAGIVILAQVLRAIIGDPSVFAAPETVPDGYGGYREVGAALYTDYVLLVEMASLILLSAIVGALILAKRKIG